MGFQPRVSQQKQGVETLGNMSRWQLTFVTRYLLTSTKFKHAQSTEPLEVFIFSIRFIMDRNNQFFLRTTCK